MELRIVQIRKKMGMTQKGLAQLCGTTQQQIAKIEGGLADPQLSTLSRIALAMGCETRDLFYSKFDFLEEIKSIVKSEKINLKTLTAIELISFCSIVAHVPTLHPYWGLICLSNNKLTMKDVV